MRRMWIVGLTCSVALCAICSAATVSGRKADYKMTMTIDTTAMMAAMGMGSKMPQGQSMPKAAPMVTTGKLIWTPAKSRSDMKNSYSGTTDTTLVDFSSHKVYMLQPLNKTAMSFSMDANPMLSGILHGGSGGGLGMAQDYASTLQQLRSVQGVSVKEIGTKKINGYDCHGLEMKIDLSKMQAALQPPVAGKEGAQTPQMGAMLSKMGTMTSDVWLSDKYHVAIKSLSKTTGMSMVMEMTNIGDWSGPDSTFAVPAGYTVQDNTAVINNMLQPGSHSPAHH